MNHRTIFIAAIFFYVVSSLIAHLCAGAHYGAQAQTIPQLPLNPFLVYGPKKFERSSGPPVTQSDRFSVPQTASSPYTLYVLNGWIDGSKRVTSATIKINGKTVLDQNDFKKIIPLIIKTVSLNKDNEIQITINGKPGTFITIAMTGTDKNPPKIVITNPVNNLVTRELQVTCTGTVTDETIAILTINGKLVLLRSGGAFTYNVQLSEGVNTINFVARDIFGNTSKEVRSVVRDTKAPVVTLTSPADGMRTPASTVLVSGSVIDATPVVVTANGQQLASRSGIPVGSNKTFSGQIPLNAGMNQITVIVTDGAGNQTTIIRTVHRTGSAPVLKVTSPVDGYITKDGAITVQGTVIDSSGTAVTVTVNGVQVPLNTNGSFNGDVTLIEGTNRITITALNGLGQSSTVLRTVRKDSMPPVLVVNNPVDGLLTKDSVVAVFGSVKDSTNVTLKVNGQLVVINPDGSFSMEMALVEGMNTVEIKATDAAGNSTIVQKSVRKDATPPVMVITAPEDNKVIRDSIITVSGSVSDSTSITVTVNDKAVILNPDGLFSAQVILDEGINQIKIEATDFLGNKTTILRSVRRDMQPPVLMIISPIDSLVTRDSVLFVQGTAFDSVGITLTVNGDTVAIGADGAWSKQITLREGKTTISIVVIDLAGNTTTLTRHITRDTLPPVITISTPSDGFITRQTKVEVTALIQDSTKVSVKVNDSTVNVTAGGVVNTDVMLIQGTDTIKVSAVDAAGNSSERRCIVVCDTLPPVLTITAPADSVVLRKDTISISGTVLDSTGVNVKINGDSVSVEADGSFSKNVNVMVGENIYTITATDLAGNTTTAVRHVIRDTSSAIISYDELVDSLTAASTGISDPFSVISNICEKKEGAIQALDELLSQDVVSDSGDTLSDKDTLLAHRPNSLLAVQVVELIGTPSACEILLQVAQLHHDVEVRGMALNALSTSYYQSVCNNPESSSGYDPDVNIIHVLLKALDDSTKVIGLDKKIGEITREGFQNWTGVDTGEPGDSNSTITDPNTGETMTVAKYRDKWWSEVGVNMTWNAAAMRFQIP
ncbi:MAG: hypothetical protein ABSB78_04685 [Bacteroidota bacterium]